MTEDLPRKGITFQCGLARESYGFEDKDLTALKELACSFLDQKVSVIFAAYEFFGSTRVLFPEQLLLEYMLSRLLG